MLVESFPDFPSSKASFLGRPSKELVQVLYLEKAVKGMQVGAFVSPGPVKQQGQTAGFGPCFHLQGNPFRKIPGFLSHSQLR